MTTLQALIDALTEALDNTPPTTPVVLNTDDFDGEGRFLALDSLLFEMGSHMPPASVTEPSQLSRPPSIPREHTLFSSVVWHDTDSQPAVAVTSPGTVHLFGWVAFLPDPRLSGTSRRTSDR